MNRFPAIWDEIPIEEWEWPFFSSQQAVLKSLAGAFQCQILRFFTCGVTVQVVESPWWPLSTSLMLIAASLVFQWCNQLSFNWKYEHWWVAYQFKKRSGHIFDVAASSLGLPMRSSASLTSYCCWRYALCWASISKKIFIFLFVSVFLVFLDILMACLVTVSFRLGTLSTVARRDLSIRSWAGPALEGTTRGMTCRSWLWQIRSTSGSDMGGYGRVESEDSHVDWYLTSSRSLGGTPFMM